MIDVFELARYGEQLPAPAEAQGTFDALLSALARTFSDWLTDASGRITDARNGPAEDHSIIEREWTDVERRARDAVRRFAEAVERQPTGATMGKVNAGKTMMLSRWYGDLEELRELPIGDADTTGCLTRLTRRGNARLDAAIRVKTLDNASFESEPAAAEDAATLDEFPQSMYVSFEPGNRDEFARALRVCRFPTADDSNYELEETRRGEYRVVRLRSGELRLRSLQLRACEVTLRVRPTQGSRAARIFEVLDLVDCPGADPQIETDASRHLKAVKNHLVFRQAVSELDVLLLVCSSQASAIRPGYQLLHGPWRHWVERCESKMRGRVVLALTYAGEALRHSAERLKDLARPENERQINTVQSLPQSVVGSVIQPLRGALDEATADALDPNDLRTWPPFVLIENRHVDPELEVAAVDVARAREAIVASLDDATMPEDTPFAWRVAHFFARSWVDDVARVRTAEPVARRRFMEWMVDVSLAVANPEDRGHELLTRLMLHLAHRGELRKAKSAEMVDLAVRAQSAISDLQERLTREPRADRAALDAMDDLVAKLRESLPRQGVPIPFPLAIRQACLRPYGGATTTWDALVGECLRAACGAVQAATRRADLAADLRPTLERMLEADGGTRRLREEEERFLGDEPSNAVHCTHFILARLAAAIDWLLHATDAERESYAARTLGIDPKKTEAYRRLRRVVGDLPLPDGVDDALAKIQLQFERLIEELNTTTQEAN
jgi:hypothetical protein